MENFNSNKLDQNDKDWVEEVNDNWQVLITDWIQQYKNYKDGALTKDKIIEITKKVAEYRNDNSLVEEIKQRLGN